jgi:hypothetical protein
MSLLAPRSVSDVRAALRARRFQRQPRRPGKVSWPRLPNGRRRVVDPRRVQLPASRNSTHPPGEAKASVRDILGLEALGLLKSRSYLVFILSSIAICIPLAFYCNFTNLFLNEIGVQSAAAVQSLGQALRKGSRSGFGGGQPATPHTPGAARPVRRNVDGHPRRLDGRAGLAANAYGRGGGSGTARSTTRNSGSMSARCACPRADPTRRATCWGGGNRAGVVPPLTF